MSLGVVIQRAFPHKAPHSHLTFRSHALTTLSIMFNLLAHSQTKCFDVKAARGKKGLVVYILQVTY